MALLPKCGWWEQPVHIISVNFRFPVKMDTTHIPDWDKFTIKHDAIEKAITTGGWVDDGEFNRFAMTYLSEGAPQISLTLSYDGSDIDFKSAVGIPVLAFEEMNCFYTEEGGIPFGKDIESVLIWAIENDSAIDAIISGRVYHLQIPQDESLPSIVYQEIATEFFDTLQDTTPLRRRTFQFNCWASDYGMAIELSEALKTCLNAAKGIYDEIKIEKFSPIDEADSVEETVNEELRRKGRRVDYQVWYQNIAA